MSDKSHEDMMRPDGKVNPIDTDYQVGQDNVATKTSARLDLIFTTEYL